MTYPVQSRSVNARLLVQMTAQFEDRLRDFRRANPTSAYDSDALVGFMLDLVNSTRARMFSKKGTDWAEVLKADTAASGHVDYEHKFALYCVELVLDVKAPPL